MKSTDKHDVDGPQSKWSQNVATRYENTLFFIPGVHFFDHFENVDRPFLLRAIDDVFLQKRSLFYKNENLLS